MKKISIVYLDINECSSGNGGCDQYCNNSIGSYECSCSIGFSLSSDRHNCSGLSPFICKIQQFAIVIDINECSDDNGDCNQTCTNTIGSYYCSCGIGFYNLTADAKNCSGS